MTDRDTLQRSRYLARTTDLTDEQARALAYREQGYSHSGIAAKIDSTKGSVSDYMRRIAAQYGLSAIWTKTEEERTDLEEVDHERLEALSASVRRQYVEIAEHAPEHVPASVREEVLGE